MRRTGASACVFAVAGTNAPMGSTTTRATIRPASRRRTISASSRLTSSGNVSSEGPSASCTSTRCTRSRSAPCASSRFFTIERQSSSAVSTSTSAGVPSSSPSRVPRVIAATICAFVSSDFPRPFSPATTVSPRSGNRTDQSHRPRSERISLAGVSTTRRARRVFGSSSGSSRSAFAAPSLAAMRVVSRCRHNRSTPSAGSGGLHAMALCPCIASSATRPRIPFAVSRDRAHASSFSCRSPGVNASSSPGTGTDAPACCAICSSPAGASGSSATGGYSPS